MKTMKRVIILILGALLVVATTTPSFSSSVSRRYVNSAKVGTYDCAGSAPPSSEGAWADGIGGACIALSGSEISISIELRDDVATGPVWATYTFWGGEKRKPVPYCGSVHDLDVPTGATRLTINMTADARIQWGGSCELAVKGTAIFSIS